MASSYYRRIHGHDANLRQGTKTDLTSARIYGTSAWMGKENLGRKDARYPTVRIADKDCRLSDNDRAEIENVNRAIFDDKDTWTRLIMRA